jgi:hypothetical protein
MSAEPNVFLLCALAQKTEGDGNESQQVGGDKGLRAGVNAGGVTGEAVKEDSGAYGEIEACGKLSDGSGNHSGEDVAGSSGGHAGISGGYHPGFAIRIGDDGSKTFKDKNAAVASGEVAGASDTIFLNLGDGASGEASHLAGMGSESQGARAG